jgi:hypothetical protein
MGWDKTGSFISGLYLGQFPFSGTVRESRVKYGGQVQHTVDLVNPIQVFGVIRNVVLIEETLDRVFA